MAVEASALVIKGEPWGKRQNIGAISDREGVTAAYAPAGGVWSEFGTGKPDRRTTREVAINTEPAAEASPHAHRNKSLDGLRGVAVLLVVTAHAHVPILKNGGTAGVTLFFVLSGYLITSILLKEQERSGAIHLGHFYARRALRLLPALVVALVVTGAVAVALDFTFHSVAVGGAASLFYYADLWPSLGFGLGPFGVSWSLAMEEQFYLVWPILLIFASRLKRPILLVATLVVATASLAARFIGPIGTLNGYNHAYYLPQSNTWALLIGCALAIWLTMHAPIRVPSAAVSTAAAIVLLASSLPGLRHGLRSVVNSQTLTTELAVGPVVAACALVLVAACVSGGVPWLRHRWLIYFGGISYGLYLWHGYLGHVIGGKLGETGARGLAVGVGLTTPVAIAAAHVSRRFVEQPFLDWKTRLEVRWREGSATIQP